MFTIVSLCSVHTFSVRSCVFLCHCLYIKLEYGPRMLNNRWYRACTDCTNIWWSEGPNGQRPKLLSMEILIRNWVVSGTHVHAVKWIKIKQKQKQNCMSFAESHEKKNQYSIIFYSHKDKDIVGSNCENDIDDRLVTPLSEQAITSKCRSTSIRIIF